MLVTAVCHHCEREWQYDKPCGGSGRRTFCSRACSNLHRGRTRNGAKKVEAICAACSKAFAGYKGQMFCSRRCAQLKNQRSRSCPVCKCEHSRRYRTCSDTCRDKFRTICRQRDLKARLGDDWQRERQIAKLERTIARLEFRVRRFLARLKPCATCSELFDDRGQDVRRCKACRLLCIGCGLPHGRRAGIRLCCSCAKDSVKAALKKQRRVRKAKWGKDTHRSRARRNGVAYERVSTREIFERDGWRCQACGCKCRRSSGKNHPREATLDHILPLSLGGDHKRTNTQCLCRQCNTSKSASTRIGAQLRLIG